MYLCAKAKYLYFHSGRIIRRFVPISKILSSMLNECVTPVTCYWSLALLLRDEGELMLVFQVTYHFSFFGSIWSLSVGFWSWLALYRNYNHPWKCWFPCGRPCAQPLMAKKPALPDQFCAITHRWMCWSGSNLLMPSRNRFFLNLILILEKRGDISLDGWL